MAGNTEVVEGVVPVHPATRLAKLRKWLTRGHAKAYALRVLVVEGEAAQVVAEHDVEDVRPSTADEVLEQLEGILEASDAKQLTANVQWVNEEGKVLLTRVECIRRRSKDDALAVGSQSISLSGKPEDQAAQAQRHLEAMGKLYTNAVAGVLQQMLRTSETAARLAEACGARVEEVERDNRRLRSQLSRALDERELPPGDDEAEEPEKTPIQQVVEMAQAVGPLLEASKSLTGK